MADNNNIWSEKDEEKECKEWKRSNNYLDYWDKFSKTGPKMKEEK